MRPVTSQPLSKVKLCLLRAAGMWANAGPQAAGQKAYRRLGGGGPWAPVWPWLLTPGPILPPEATHSALPGPGSRERGPCLTSCGQEQGPPCRPLSPSSTCGWCGRGQLLSLRVTVWLLISEMWPVTGAARPRPAPRVQGGRAGNVLRTAHHTPSAFHPSQLRYHYELCY